jgi:hypothetical protein
LLDLVAKLRKQGKSEVGEYYAAYAAAQQWAYAAGVVDGRAAMLVYDRNISLEAPAYFVALDFDGDRVVSIHDFLFARYAMDGVDLQARALCSAQGLEGRTCPSRMAQTRRAFDHRHEHQPPQVSSRLPSRLVSWASAPEFGELLGKGSALVVTGSSGGRTRRRIHHIDANAECVLRVAIREDGFDPAAACA